MVLSTRIAKNVLGAFAGLSLVGLVGGCAYMCMYLNTNAPWQLYQFGRLGVLTILAYVIAVASLVAVIFYIVSVFFIIGNCCGGCKKGMLITGTIIWAGCFVCECLFVAWNNWDLENVIFDEAKTERYQKYASAFAEKQLPAYFLPEIESVIPGLNNFDLGLPPTFGAGMAKVEVDGAVRDAYVSLPVCYFPSEKDKREFSNANCSGKWTGERMKAYFEKLEERKKEAEEREKWDEDKRERWEFHFTLNHMFMYTNKGAYGIFPIFLGVQIGALFFGTVYVLIAWCACCCGSGRVSPEP